MSPEQLDSAKRECVVQSTLKHPNVVQLYEYTETEEDVRIFMEYMNMPDYLSEKIEEVFDHKNKHIGRDCDQLRIKKNLYVLFAKLSKD